MKYIRHTKQLFSHFEVLKWKFLNTDPVPNHPQYVIDCLLPKSQFHSMQKFHENILINCWPILSVEKSEENERHFVALFGCV